MLVQFIGPAPTGGKRTKRGESENRERNESVARRAAKKSVRQACKTIGADRMITLTYRASMTDREMALKHWDRFRRRMRKSRGIPKPEVQSWPIASVTAVGAVQTAFAIAESGLLDGAQFWYNKALDVIWIATVPYNLDTAEAVPFYEAKKIMGKRTDTVFGMSNEVLSDSYVDRGDLDGELKRLLGRRVHVAIRGPSKSGKSWLRQRVIPNALVVQCRLGSTNIDIYTSALAELDIRLEVESTSKFGLKGSVEASGSVGNDLIGKVTGKIAGEVSTDDVIKSAPIGKNLTDLKFIANLLIGSGRRLIIEDVHYLSPDQREILAYDLKAFWDYGCFVALVGVWGDSNMFVRLNSELSGRIHEMSVEWAIEDLRKILVAGSQALNIVIQRDIQNKCIADAFSNAGLLQRLILQTLGEAKIFESGETEQVVSDSKHYVSAAMAVAEQLNGVYQKFGERVAFGIRKRSDATGIYAHAMAVIIDASDGMHMTGIPADYIFEQAHKRQPRIQKSNLKAILSKIDGLQIDENGRGLIVTYDVDGEKVLNVDRQLLFYRKYLTVMWPWEQLIAEVEQMSQNSTDIGTSGAVGNT